jgi:hypothetical protein
MNAMRSLLDLNAAEDTLGGPAEIWASKITAALSGGDTASAERWLGTVAGLDLGVSQRRLLLKTLADHLDDAAVERLVDILASDAGPGTALRGAAPFFAADRLVAELGAEQQMARRRVIIKALTRVAAANPGAVVPHLRDPRWYVVRNVALILGSSRRPEAASHLREVLGHDDHRVRIEALVGLRRLLDAGAVPALLAALDDPLEPVTARAAGLLSQLDDPEIDRQLVLRLERASDRQRMLRLIAALGLRTTDDARQALRTRAAGWFPFWGTAAAVRKAARAALEGPS